MSVVADIVKSWVHPRPVLRRHVDAGQREDRALIFLMIGCLLVFLSQIPMIVRNDWMGSDTPFQAQIGGAAMAWLFIMPLLLYIIAALSRFLGKVFGGKGSAFSARLALFWALFAASPWWLLNGVVTGYFGAGSIGSYVVGAVALLVFLYIWAMGFIETEFGRGAAS